jgi:hypothetical protein
VTERLRIPAAIVAVVLALALVLGGQAWADAAAPSVPNGALTGQAMGRAGFAYLTGLRKFAAALLWNRLEPQMHKYYGETGLGNMVFMLPNIKAIVTLDPQFVEGYYVAPEILIESGRKPGVPAAEAKRRLDAALALAKEGVTNNPKSGLMLTSYAQLLWTEGKDLKAAIPYAIASLAKDIVWRTDEEQWDQFALMRALFRKSGDTARAAQTQAVMDAIDANPNATKNAVDTNE